MVELTVKVNRENRKALSSDLSFPTSWDELNPSQFLYIAKYWEAWQSIMQLGESMVKARSLLMLELCGLDSYFEKKKLCHMLSFVDEKTEYNILDCTNFVFEKLKLTKNHLPKIKVGMFEWYYGPKDRLSDISIDEFSFAFSCYMMYMRTKDETHLDNLVAVLYRPYNKDYHETGRIRADFSPDKIELYVKKTKRLKYEYKHGVLLFFMGVIASFEKKYGSVFRRASKENTASSMSFLDTIIQMSGGKFGPFDTTKRENLHVILKELNHLIENSHKKK